MDTLTEIKYNIDPLVSVLTEIKIYLSLAKLGTLQSSMVGIQELDSTLQTLLNHHSLNRLVFFNSNEIKVWNNLVGS